jgi:hypothetical protein
LEVSISAFLESSWRIEGFVEKTLESFWNTGEGDYYWYRVEGVCGTMGCDEYGVAYDQCNKMTFFTVVPARNISELCDQLRSPTINPPVRTRISSIKRYSRPLVKSTDPNQCNVLDEQDFCHVPECFDYCVDEDIIFSLGVKMNVVDTIYESDMSGGLFVRGSVQTDRYRFYEPEFPVIGFDGRFVLSTKLNFVSSGGFSFAGGVYERTLTIYEFNASDGGVDISGFSTFSTPRRSLFNPEGGFVFSGSVGFRAGVAPTGGLQISGSSSNILKGIFRPSGSLNILGSLSDNLSPGYHYSFDGGLLVSLDSEVVEGISRFNFKSLGVVSSRFAFNMRTFDLASDLGDLSYRTTLTISDQTISPSCGCGPLGLSLLLSHNFSNSTILSNFIKRNGFILPPSVPMRYRSDENSWKGIVHYLGRSGDGFSMEDWTIVFTFACNSDSWRFAFSTTMRNELADMDGHTKFVADIPIGQICQEGRSTNIKLMMESRGLVASSGRSKLVTNSSSRNIVKTRNYRPECYINDVLNDYVVYYDNLNLFKNSYWKNVPLEMSINPASSGLMPTIDLQKIF